MSNYRWNGEAWEPAEQVRVPLLVRVEIRLRRLLRRWSS